MRPYLVSVALLYAFYALILLASALGMPLSLLRPQAPTLHGWGPTLLGLLFLGVSLLCAWAAWRYSPRRRLVAQGAALTLGGAWLATLVIETALAISDGGRLLFVLLALIWAWVIYTEAGAVRYYDISPEEETRARRMLDEIRRTGRAPDARRHAAHIASDLDSGALHDKPLSRSAPPDEPLPEPPATDDTTDTTPPAEKE